MMNSEQILKSDVLDILFEKRNKAYGAYMHRKFYKKRLIMSVGMMMAAMVVFSAFTYLPDKPFTPVDLRFTETELGHVPVPLKVPEVKPALASPANRKPLSNFKLPANMLIVNSKDSTDLLRDLNENSLVGSYSNSDRIDPGVIGPEGTATQPGKEPSQAIEQPVDISRPVNNPEIMPEYPGGMDALRKFLVRNFRNPRDLEDGELITVKVSFVVGFDGKLQRFELVQDGGSEFNNEVMRVLKRMPAWTPGKSKGRNVPVIYTIPVKFVREE